MLIIFFLFSPIKNGCNSPCLLELTFTSLSLFFFSPNPYSLFSIPTSSRVNLARRKWKQLFQNWYLGPTQ
ncbi:hypothetical protein JHK82_053418 [Glycine max]|uniref:Uncharacterized protein n=2 Tax=Glycine subgen. Soja TaxID=1462606 RepID=K7MY20_SOYBN|nr:hypothetical protein JHK86_053271 [Glycine max]KAG4915783.1 hypothetical protein JHK87_053340 [Glycine soja]KAG4927723.1 hypothetical protein JHK85_054209 [Glycine max]KAG5083250.1 hypothetical protein JHK84_053288 [Glycine max]KAG5086021.1 hypothetical protein JHK82_053418 [Glycine max]